MIDVTIRSHLCGDVGQTVQDAKIADQVSSTWKSLVADGQSCDGE